MDNIEQIEEVKALAVPLSLKFSNNFMKRFF